MTTLAEWRAARVDALVEQTGRPSRGVAVEALRRVLRSPMGLLGLVIVALFVLVAVFAHAIAPNDPGQSFEALKSGLTATTIPGPQPGFPLGSDQFGRDLLSRLVVGSQQSLFVGVLATLIGLALGMLLGGISGAVGGWVDSLIMRVVDIMLSIPGLLLAITLAAVVRRPDQWTVIIAVAAVSVPIFARLLRGAMLAQRDADHVLAATALGVRRRSVVLRHMLPNALGPVIVQATLTLATAILDAAALSFLGLGDQDPTRAEWGLMLGDAQRYLDVRMELAYYPAICIIIVALGFTLLGESLREALDPKNRR
jgi:peptide/nickel transport system permease protein